MPDEPTESSSANTSPIEKTQKTGSIRKTTSMIVAAELEQRYPGATFQVPEPADKVSLRIQRPVSPQVTPIKRLTQINCDEAGRVLRPIEDEPYYHGFLSREEVEKIIKKEGEFLVRKTEVAGRHYFVISLKDGGIMKHFLIKRTSKKRLYWVNDYAFKSVNDLIEYHLRNRAPLSTGGVYLEKACPKEQWQLNPEQIEPVEKIGEGAFGEVYKGLLQEGFFGARIPVAIKTLHSTNMTADDRIKFLQEANIMRGFRHENVIRLHGVCTSKEPIMIVMELCPGGSLLLRLQDLNNQPSLVTKINYVYGAARGMAYLQSKDIIHRDIAARNCLLGENDVLKISDFGLSFIGKTLMEKKLKKVPLRWLSPETLKSGVYSTKTDVYSFSIMIWEIFSFGQLPFYKFDNRQLRKLIIQKKAKLPKCLGDIPPEMEKLRLRCMDPEPDKRPDFIELEEIISEMPDVIKPKPPSLWNRISTAIGDYVYGRSST
ncbi:unnamed protein product [Cylicocyclus nassatus]|uniref:Tyrosine-protein kinase n=1 Tax=Cylicocyclus nassatus TaxID=53992 RepID=A0AA36GLF0_CYLNA|nr:unnamed protein product [Cylicocyclus nassatus]